jgi:divalent metal cation (Fe/Co/Zn/Cd) transporter
MDSQHGNAGWWLDPTFAVAISVWIMWRWFLIARAQVHKLVGRGAPADFIEQLRAIADEHHEDLTVDVVRAYHFGA